MLIIAAPVFVSSLSVIQVGFLSILANASACQSLLAIVCLAHVRPSLLVATIVESATATNTPCAYLIVFQV